MSQPTGNEPIAIVGMAGRFPGAADLGQFWANLLAGTVSVRLPADAELLGAGVSARALADPDYVRATAAAPDIDAFDAGLFGMTPREARICDPQIRLFLECAHAAMEDAGYDHTRRSDVGVFAAAGPNRYLDLVRRSEGGDPRGGDPRGGDPRGGDLRGAAGMAVTTWNSTDYVATLVSYKLGLHGPSLAVATACSSSLVAVHLAAASLRAGECEMALAGAANVELPLGHGYWWEPDGTLSRDGQSRPFDQDATGMVCTSGGGAVALKRLADAVADRDHIHAVIRSTSINNDGAGKVSFTAPGVHGQASAAAEALALSGVDPGDVALAEAHATGSALGDPIEVEALSQAFRRLGVTHPGQVAIASVKGNIGHLGHASGIASLIKVALALENETIPPTAGFREPNPALALDRTPFHVSTRAAPWPRRAGKLRCATVNAYGVGGTNVHAVLQEAPPVARVAVPQRPQVVVWSARTPAAADTARDRLAGHLERAGADSFVRGVFTLQQGRTAHGWRGAAVAASGPEAAALLRDPAAGHLIRTATGAPSRIAFLFPGVGAQHPRLARELYARSGAFARALDGCLALFEADGLPLREVWRDGDEARLRHTPDAEALLFAVEYALVAAWRSWGGAPAAVLGYGIGELVAATVAGVFPVRGAVRVVAARSRALAGLPPGRMLAVRASAATVQPLLPGTAAIAAVDGPSQVIVACDAADLAPVVAALDAAGLAHQPVPAGHGLYAATSAAAAPAIERALRGVELSAPDLRLFSASLGGLVPAAAATDPRFWAQQVAEPVRFAGALDALTGEAPRLTLVEVGPGRTLTALLRQHPSVLAGRHRAVATLPRRAADGAAERAAVLTAVASVWADGHDIDWTSVEDLSAAGRCPLPGYPYERTRYWADPPADAQPVTAPVAAPVIAPVAAPAVALPGAVPPAGSAQTTVDRLRGIWTALLGHDGIGAEADFFDLGGNSLTAAELMSRVRAEFGVKLGLDSLFDAPTLAGLGDLIDGRDG